MAAKQVAEDGDGLQMPLLPAHLDLNSYTPIYTPEEREKALRWGYFKSPEYLGWMVNGHGQWFLPSAVALQATREAHQSTHYRQEALYQWLIKSMTTPNFHSLLKQVVEAGPICLWNKPNTPLPQPQGQWSDPHPV